MVRKLAAGLGFEPRYAGPEPAVLPLDDPAMSEVILPSFFSSFFLITCHRVKRE